MGFFIWLEQTGFAQWVHESESVFAFPTFLTAHVTGMGVLVGLATVINLRLLGCIPRVPLTPMATFFPVMWYAFYANVVTGAALFASDATAKVQTLDFYIKLVLVALGMLSLVAIRSEVFRSPAVDKVPVSSKGKTLAVISLILWAGAITAARLIAYLAPRHHAAFLFQRLGSLL
ncbi:MAG TPA: hypothetical protein VER98_19860 [Terriglobia bacterium]|nr:hypothetical protein [Terriglobia bacterium]